MKTCYEHIEIDQSKIMVDVSEIKKTATIYFNATQIAKPFNKKVKDFLKLNSTHEYIHEIFKEDLSPLKIDDLIRIKRGKYGGTWLHNELSFEFAGWCSPVFRYKLHKWAKKRLNDAKEWERSRLESRSGFLPMTEAICDVNSKPSPYHFSNEADMINRIVFGMPAKKVKEIRKVKYIREGATSVELFFISYLQFINTGLIITGVPYSERQTQLKNCYDNKRHLIEIENVTNRT